MIMKTKVVMAEVRMMRMMVEVVMVMVTKMRITMQMRMMVAMGGVRMMATTMVAMMKCW